MLAADTWVWCYTVCRPTTDNSISMSSWLHRLEGILLPLLSDRYARPRRVFHPVHSIVASAWPLPCPRNSNIASKIGLQTWWRMCTLPWGTPTYFVSRVLTYYIDNYVHSIALLENTDLDVKPSLNDLLISMYRVLPCNVTYWTRN